MRRTSLLSAGLLFLVSTPSCAGGAMPTTLDGVLKAVGSLTGDMGGFFQGLDMSNLTESALAPLGALVGQAEGLGGALKALPSGAMDKAEGLTGFDSFKETLSSVGGFDLDGLMGAGAEGKRSMLEGLMGQTDKLGDLSKSLLGQLGM